ncbi:MAG: hypothetical protein ACR2JZ_06120 [Candidatus Limnocylindrales bacterium]
MEGLYPWIVFLHVAAAFGFAMGHGVSMFVSDQVRRERDPVRIRSLLELSSSSLATVYGALAVMVLTGIVAGVMGGHFNRFWIWLSLGILVAIAVAMYLLASRYYALVRHAVGLPSYLDPKGAPPPEPASVEELDQLLRTKRPDVIALVGSAGFLAVLWLMMAKPF